MTQNDTDIFRFDSDAFKNIFGIPVSEKGTDTFKASIGSITMTIEASDEDEAVEKFLEHIADGLITIERR